MGDRDKNPRAHEKDSSSEKRWQGLIPGRTQSKNNEKKDATKGYSHVQTQEMVGCWSSEGNHSSEIPFLK